MVSALAFVSSPSLVVVAPISVRSPPRGSFAAVHARLGRDVLANTRCSIRFHSFRVLLEAFESKQSF